MEVKYKQDRFFDVLLKNKISLKKYYHLYLFHKKGIENDDIRWYIEKKERGKGIIEEVEELFKSQTSSTKDVLGEDYIERIEEYRNIFPKTTLSSGKPARCSVNNLTKVFVWFFKNYNYDWETIYKATRLYVDTNDKYMKTSQYFVRKDNTSSLADMCEQILNGDETIEIKQKVV